MRERCLHLALPGCVRAKRMPGCGCARRVEREERGRHLPCRFLDPALLAVPLGPAQPVNPRCFAFGADITLHESDLIGWHVETVLDRKITTLKSSHKCASRMT